MAKKQTDEINRVLIVLSLLSFLGTFVALGFSLYTIGVSVNPQFNPSDLQGSIMYNFGIVYMIFGVIATIYILSIFRKLKAL